ncbi:MAG: AAA family ATPase [Elusimicrobia bacterium]|nr:AAA family ATPase [Elusimicrobiota bacterium]
MINKLLELNELAKSKAAKYPKKRRIYQDIVSAEGKAFIGITGPRGVGKTVLLRQIAGDVKESFYLSADTLGEAELFETAKTLTQRYGIRLLLLDEIHQAPDYAASLKKIYDFLDLRVVFTSSVALSLAESAHDLSRRAVLRRMWPFPFGEYLQFAHARTLPALTLADILERRWEPEHLRQGYLLDDYMKGGLFPFAAEEPQARPVLESILEKIIRRDIPSVAGLRLDEVGLIEKAVRFIGRSACEGISYSSISRNLGITKYKAEQYIRLLEKAYVLNPVMPAGTNVLREPKVLMFLPFRTLYMDAREAEGGRWPFSARQSSQALWEAGEGGLREDFAAQSLRMAGLEFHYLKDKQGGKTPDFLVKEAGGEVVVEVGGKGITQFKGYRAERKLRLTSSDSIDGDQRPMFLLGFL